MDTATVIVLIIVATSIVVLRLCYKPQTTEHLTDDEAIRNVASVYNKNKMTVTDLDITGSLNILPIGTVIALWTDKIPDGWQICDGTNGTPDLRGRTIIGAGQGKGLTKRVLQSMGGEETHKLTPAEMPKHSHAQYTFTGNQGGSWYSFDAAGGHYGGPDRSNYAGGDAPHNNMPPFASLNWIMRIR